MTLAQLNDLPAEAAFEQLLQCCGSAEWARELMGLRPFATLDELLKEAHTIWQRLEPQDWLEAFAAHPRIGERSASAWSQQEQAQALSAADDMRQAMARANEQYEHKFGYIFIVSADGKTPQEILDSAKTRLQNGVGEELRVAAREQARIMEHRLLKLLT